MKMFFCGIAGSGMAPIAMLLQKQGVKISGSDRLNDKSENLSVLEKLKSLKINIFPQDGSGITADTDLLVISSAIEDDNPDVLKAKSLGVCIKKRAEVLAEIFHKYLGIAVGGTSGKSTTTAITGHILKELGRDPLVINGAEIISENSSVIYGQGDICVIEADESDGSILNFKPNISILTNISEDHKGLEELIEIFKKFIKNGVNGAVINLDCPYSKTLIKNNKNVITISVRQNPEANLYADNIVINSDSIIFSVNNIKTSLNLIGIHNIYNALCAVAGVMQLGVSLEEALKALSTFRGVKRRLELIANIKGIKIIDDFAHNPEKIKASLNAIKSSLQGRIILFYQPHGFKPTFMMKDALVKVLQENTDNSDIIIMPEIYYTGGTTQKNISSKDITKEISNSIFVESRAKALGIIIGEARRNDTIIIMGARDNTLSDFAKEIVKCLS